MDRFEALYSFWAGFGIPAYEQNSVPDADSISFPYITYEAVVSGFDEDAFSNASIWTRNTSWSEADRLSDMIEADLKNGGRIVPYSGGMLWITPEAPFSQSMGDDADNLIKRKVLSVAIHFS